MNALSPTPATMRPASTTNTELPPQTIVKRGSIRRHLALMLMAFTGLLWAIVTAFGLYGVRHEAEEVVDAQLTLAGHVLLTMLAHEMHEGYANPGHAFARIVPDIFPASGYSHVDPPAFIVRGADNHLILHSKSAKPLVPVIDQAVPPGFDTRTVGTTEWRLLVLQDPETGLWVAVAHPTHLQEELAYELAYNFIGPLLLALPMLWFIIYLSVKRGLKPLRRLAAKVSRRSVNDSTALTDEQVPVEALPLTQALDDLLQRLEQSHRREQRFIADATHELRTPLAGLKTQAQVAIGAANSKQRNAALASLNQGVDHATRLIAQLLTLARLDHQPCDDEGKPGDLLDVALNLCMELSQRALDAGVELSLSGDESCLVPADRTLLSILVRNLVENAIQYGGNGGEINIGVECDDQTVVLTVRDHGQGVPEQDLERVFERFYRSANHYAPGSGLGLSIVRAIADSCAAEISLSNHPEGGLSVAVTFPRA